MGNEIELTAAGEAVQALQESGAAIKLGAPLLDTHHAAAAVPENFKELELEQYEEYRRQYRARYATHLLASYGDYFEAMDKEGLTVYVDAESMKARGIFDLGSIAKPGHCKHVAELTLRKTAAFSEFLRFAGNEHSQRETAEFFEDWAERVTAFAPDGEEISLTSLVAIVRDLDIETARNLNSQSEDFSEARTAMEKIEAKSKKGAMPAMLYFECEPYHGLDSRKFPFRISIRTGGNRPGFLPRRVREDEIAEAMAAEFSEKLADVLKDRATPIEGTLDVNR